MTGGYLVAALVLLLANGFFVAAEFSLMAVRRTQVEHLASGGEKRATAALKSVRELSLMLAAAQLGITMASLGLGYVAEPAIAQLLEDAIHSVADLSPGVLHSISFVIALVIVSFLHMVVGEMAPKNFAIAEPEKTVLRVALPFRLFANAFRPVIHALNGIANATLKMVGVAPKDELQFAHTADEIARMVGESAKGGLLKEFERRLLVGAAGFGDRDAASVMVPRTEITALPRSATPEEIERLALDTGHSRFPIHTENLDHIIGFFHIKDLLKIPESGRRDPIPRRLIRPLLVVPESRRLQGLLLDMKRERKHFALVVEEHGGTAGIVTLEDLLEEIVGDIIDEYDEEEAGIQRLDADRYLVPGTLRIDEAKDRLGVDLPEGEYETIAGFIMDQLGRIPHRRDLVQHDAWRLRVLNMRRRRVLQVLIERDPAAESRHTEEETQR